MSFGILITSLSLVLAAHHRAPKQDLASQGASEYQDGNYAKAVVSLHKAVQQSPNNAYAWFNLGRASVANGQITGSPDECDEERAWKYVAMRAFNKALSLEHAEILAKLKQNDPKLVLFRETAEYRKWFASLGPFPRGDDETHTFFTETNPSWFLPTGDVIFMDLEPGGTVQRYGPTDDDHGDAEGHWRIRKGALEVTLNDGKVSRYGLLRGPYSWQLKGPEGHWEPGPILRDCSSKKK